MTRRILIPLTALFLIIVGFYFGATWARSDDLKPIDPARIKPIADAVREEMKDRLPIPSPALPMVYAIRLVGVDGITIDGDITINLDAPTECFPVIFAHEYVHWAYGKFYGKTPDESEPLARAMEREAVKAYLPGCYSSKKQIGIGEALIAMKGE